MQRLEQLSGQLRHSYVVLTEADFSAKGLAQNTLSEVQVPLRVDLESSDVNVLQKRLYTKLRITQLQ